VLNFSTVVNNEPQSTYKEAGMT